MTRMSRFNEDPYMNRLGKVDDDSGEPYSADPGPPHLAVELLRKRCSTAAMSLAEWVALTVGSWNVAGADLLTERIFTYVERYAELCGREERAPGVDRQAFGMLVNRALRREMERQSEQLTNLGKGLGMDRKDNH